MMLQGTVSHPFLLRGPGEAELLSQWRKVSKASAIRKEHRSGQPDACPCCSPSNSSSFLSSFSTCDFLFGLKTFFVESVCVDPEVIAANIVVSTGKFA